MQVRYRLAAGVTLVDADVVTVRLSARLYQLTGLSQPKEKRPLLFVSGFKNRLNVARRDYERVTGRNRETICHD